MKKLTGIFLFLFCLGFTPVLVHAANDHPVGDDNTKTNTRTNNPTDTNRINTNNPINNQYPTNNYNVNNKQSNRVYIKDMNNTRQNGINFTRTSAPANTTTNNYRNFGWLGLLGLLGLVGFRKTNRE